MIYEYITKETHIEIVQCPIAFSIAPPAFKHRVSEIAMETPLISITSCHLFLLHHAILVKDAIIHTS